MKHCSQCKLGENKVEADFQITGRRLIKGRWMAYKANICKAHLHILIDHGLCNVKVTQAYSEQAIKAMEEIKHLPVEIVKHFPACELLEKRANG